MENSLLQFITQMKKKLSSSSLAHNSENIRGLPFDDRDSAEMCDIVIAETPTNYNDAIEIISISSSLSNSEKGKPHCLLLLSRI